MTEPINNAPGLIYVMGIDGSGKSTVSEHLAEKFRQKGCEVDILWLRFNHVFTKPLLGICRLLGYTKYETNNGIRVGYHDFYRSSIVSWLFIWLQYLDALRVKYTKILPLYRKSGHILILDRYVYDILIDMAVDTKKENLLSSRIADRFIRLLPEDALTILVTRNLPDILEVRPEGKIDRNFVSRYKHFEKLKGNENIYTLDNSGTLHELLDEVESIAGIKNEG